MVTFGCCLQLDENFMNFIYLFKKGAENKFERQMIIIPSSKVLNFIFKCSIQKYAGQHMTNIHKFEIPVKIVVSILTQYPCDFRITCIVQYRKQGTFPVTNEMKMMFKTKLRPRRNIITICIILTNILTNMDNYYCSSVIKICVFSTGYLDPLISTFISILQGLSLNCVHKTKVTKS